MSLLLLFAHIHYYRDFKHDVNWPLDTTRRDYMTWLDTHHDGVYVRYISFVSQNNDVMWPLNARWRDDTHVTFMFGIGHILPVDRRFIFVQFHVLFGLNIFIGSNNKHKLYNVFPTFYLIEFVQFRPNSICNLLFYYWLLCCNEGYSY